MDERLLLIEELRRRAKDNKASNAKYYLTKSFNLQIGLRNLLLTSSIAIIGLSNSQAFDLNLNAQDLKPFLYSLIIGITSYAFGYLGLMHESRYYSSIEKIFAVGFPDPTQYEQMIADEENLRKNKRNYWWILSIILVLLQAVIIAIGLWKLI